MARMTTLVPARCVAALPWRAAAARNRHRRSSSAPSTTPPSGRPDPGQRDGRREAPASTRSCSARSGRRTDGRPRPAAAAPGVAGRGRGSTSSRSSPSTSSARRRRSTPATAQPFAAYAASSRGASRGAPGDRRQRAEPQPLLGAAVRHGRERRGRRRRTRRCSRRPTTRSRRSVAAEVIGGGLAPRGGDDPPASRQTHSPTAFIRDLGAAYRASGRTRPLMDAFSIHVYGESPRIPPVARASAHDLDRDRRLPAARRAARLGVRRHRAAGSDLPIVYGEYGVETASRRTRRRSTPAARSCRRPPETQAAFYRQAIELARRQPTVRMLCFFHVDDETRLAGLQSGVRYADGTPKPSLAAVRAAPRAGASLRAMSESGQYIAYTFFRVDPAWRRLPVEERAAAKDAFADVVDEFASRVRGAARLLDDRCAARDRLLPLEDHRALRRPRRARRRAQRDAARRLARDAVLVPRDDEGVAVHVGAAGAARSSRRDRRTSSSTRS